MLRLFGKCFQIAVLYGYYALYNILLYYYCCCFFKAIVPGQYCQLSLLVVCAHTKFNCSVVDLDIFRYGFTPYVVH